MVTTTALFLVHVLKRNANYGASLKNDNGNGSNNSNNDDGNTRRRICRNKKKSGHAAGHAHTSADSRSVSADGDGGRGGSPALLSCETAAVDAHATARGQRGARRAAGRSCGDAGLELHPLDEVLALRKRTLQGDGRIDGADLVEQVEHRQQHRKLRARARLPSWAVCACRARARRWGPGRGGDGERTWSLREMALSVSHAMGRIGL